jgi:hypothetical protein
MKLLQALCELDDFASPNFGSNAIPPATMDALQKSIRDGVKPDKDTGQYQNWANALHLVHKAYEVNGIQRPTPNMADAWKQYEENIQFAVKQLSKTFGMEGNWRMSSSVFHEALEMAKDKGFEVEITEGESTTAYNVSADGAEDVITSLKETAHADGYKVKILEEDDTRTITFWRNNVKKKGFTVTIQS